jgi:hypothetical protein
MRGSLPSGKVGNIVVRVNSSRSVGRRMPKFLKPLILLLTVAAAAATFGVGTAQASRCSDALIRDWYVDGRIDNTYPVHCYHEALKDIPEDQIVYGTLRDDLNRALFLVTRNHPDGGVTPMTPVPGAGNGGGSTGGADSSTGGTHDEGFFHWLAKKVGPSTADSVPVPLLVLGGLALALIAAAGISYGARRYQARKAAADPPPAGPYV